MTQHFVEAVEQPQLFVLSQQLKYNEKDEQLAEFLIKFEAEFQEGQNFNWTKYWGKHGQEIVLQTWKLKYKDYLADTFDLSQEKQQEQINEAPGDPTELTCKIETLETAIKENPIEDLSWQELWQQHSEEIYCEQYILYSSIYYNYFLDLKNSLQREIEVSDKETKQHKIESSETQFQIAAELEQLQLLGLPTAFGGRPQANSKKNKDKNNTTACWSVFFSDDDDDDNDIDVLDYFNSIEEIKEVTSSNIEMDSEKQIHSILDKSIEKSNKQKKNKNRKLRKVPSFILEDKSLLKYWRKRFSLFSRFDEGIRLDRESWFSVTPEKVAAHLAERLTCDILIDGFCGSGGNAIQFAKTCQLVIAVDIDPLKIEMAKHNATIYGVANKIQFIVGDFFHLCSHLRGDIVFLSPPWGGPKYKNKSDYDVEKFLLPVGASVLVEHARHISDNVALFLPRNSNLQQIVKIAGIGKRCEVEHNYLDTRLVAITAIYGENILREDK